MHLFSKFSFAQCSLEISDTTHINCNGDNTGAIGLNVLNAAQPYTVNLSNGAVAVNGDSFSGLTAGTYQLILLDANLCSDTVEIKLKEPSLLTLNLRCESNNLLAEVSGELDLTCTIGETFQILFFQTILCLVLIRLNFMTLRL